MRFALAGLASLILLVAPSSQLGAQAPPPEVVAAVAVQPPPVLQDLVAELAREHIPRQYENTKKWGGTKRVLDGIALRREGLKIETKRRWKEVNHGTWKRYQVWLIDPDRNLAARIEHVTQAPDGTIQFDFHVRAALGAFGRLSHWEYDVQLLSLGVDAEAWVDLRLRCQVALKLDARQIPPDLLLVPQVLAANLHLVEFRLKRISNLNGALAHELGEELHDVLQDELRERQDGLVNKMNAQIAKRQDRLRISIADYLKRPGASRGESTP